MKLGRLHRLRLGPFLVVRTSDYDAEIREACELLVRADILMPSPGPNEDRLYAEDWMRKVWRRRVERFLRGERP